jgi:type II secretory pathway pseudopilin PulG
MFKKQTLPGISIPELLVGFLIVGIIIAVFVYALGVQRATSRDAKRVSDISVMRATLSQYWLTKATYPISEGVYLGKPGVERLAGNGFTVKTDATQPIFLENLPIGPGKNEFYGYRGNEKGYSLFFDTERETAYGPPGRYYAHSNGVDKLDEIK